MLDYRYDKNCEVLLTTITNVCQLHLPRYCNSYLCLMTNHKLFFIIFLNVIFESSKNHEDNLSIHFSRLFFKTWASKKCFWLAIISCLAMDRTHFHCTMSMLMEWLKEALKYIKVNIKSTFSRLFTKNVFCTYMSILMVKCKDCTSSRLCIRYIM